MIVLRYFDIVLVVAAAPILLLIGVPAVGYLGGAAAWIALRFVGAVVDRRALALADQRAMLSLKLGYLIGRLFLLALAVIAVRSADGRDAGLTALMVIVAAFTSQLVTSIADRPGSR
jgi:hypothetical protein